MGAELEQDLLHLERGRKRLDEGSRADRSMRHANVRLREVEDIVPEPRFLVVLHFGKVEVRARAARDELLRVVEEVEREVEQRRGDWGVVDRHARLV